jgi:hypothetical protein
MFFLAIQAIYCRNTVDVCFLVFFYISVFVESYFYPLICKTSFVGEHEASVYSDLEGTRFWVPKVKRDLVPFVDRCFSTFHDVVAAYRAYAEAAGFVVRVGGFKKWKGVITHRILLCNRAGYSKTIKKEGTVVDSVEEGGVKTTFSTNCPACLKVKAVTKSSSFVVYKFDDRHNHEMVSTDNMDLTRTGRELTVSDAKFIHSMSVNGIGPTVAHRLHSTLVGGHHLMHGTKNAYKNLSRDVRVLIGERDVQMVITQFQQKQKHQPNFAYEILHENGHLKCLFLADHISRIHYESFGDVVAFDATYSTNMYFYPLHFFY